MTQNPKVTAILQARCSSRRLPGKVLKEVLGTPMLFYQIERIKCSQLVDHIVVATSVEESDNDLAQACQEKGHPYFRGSLNDVLDRFYQAATIEKPDIVVRLTGDCPFIDPLVIDHCLKVFLDGNFDYVSNCFPRSFPDGLDTEVMSFSALEKNWREAKSESDREHVTPYIYNHPEIFRIGNYEQDKDLSKLRWTVDTSEDFEFVSTIAEALGSNNRLFTTQDILTYLEKHPQLNRVNT